MSAVDVEGLDISYGRAEALKDVSLDLRKGEVLAVLGMNGSGKSTLMKAMLGLMPPTKGIVRHFGGEPSIEARRKMAAVFDEAAHWDRLTGWENAYFFARSYGLGDAEAQERLVQMFEWAGLGKKRDQPVGTYSYGMRRKLSIIEAMAHRPEVLFMDEPTMGLDHVSMKALNQALRRMADEQGAVMITTNDVSEASAVADRVCILNHGRLLTIGPPDQLLRSLDMVAQIDIRLQHPAGINDLRNVDGVDEVAYDDEERAIRLYVRTGEERPEAVLARAVASLDGSGASIEGISVRRPDLGYILTELDRREQHPSP